MKKTVVVLIVVLVLVSVVFVVGWIQLLVPVDSYAAVHTGTSGWKPEPLLPGRFAWSVERLIPENLTIHPYSIQPRSFDLSIQGELPSAALFAALLEGPPDFRFLVRFFLSWSVNPEWLPSLAGGRGLLPLQFEDWLRGVDERIRVEVDGMVGDLAAEDSRGSLADRIQDKLAGVLPYVTVVDIRVPEAKLPDSEWYQRGRELYLYAAEVKRSALESTGRDRALRSVVEGDRPRLLKQYGELLSRYPVLISYLKIEPS